jgi:hypothetical protein
MAFAITVALLLKSTATALALEALLGSAVIGVVFGRFCAGSYLYDLLRSALSAAHAEGCPSRSPVRSDDRYQRVVRHRPVFAPLG